MQRAKSSNGYSNRNGTGNGLGTTQDMWDFWFKYLIATIILPRNNNEREMFPPAKIQQAIDYIINIFGGATEYAPGISYWKNDGRGLDKDHISVIQVLVPYTTETLHNLNTIAATLEEKLEQDEDFIFWLLTYFVSDLLLPNGPILWQHPEEDPEAGLAPLSI